MIKRSHRVYSLLLLVMKRHSTAILFPVAKLWIHFNTLLYMLNGDSGFFLQIICAP